MFPHFHLVIEVRFRVLLLPWHDRTPKAQKGQQACESTPTISLIFTPLPNRARIQWRTFGERRRNQYSWFVQTLVSINDQSTTKVELFILFSLKVIRHSACPGTPTLWQAWGDTWVVVFKEHLYLNQAWQTKPSCVGCKRHSDQNFRAPRLLMRTI